LPSLSFLFVGLDVAAAEMNEDKDYAAEDGGLMKPQVKQKNAK